MSYNKIIRNVEKWKDQKIYKENYEIPWEGLGLRGTCCLAWHLKGVVLGFSSSLKTSSMSIQDT